MKNGILFIFSLFYEYSNLEYVHFDVIHRVNQAEHGIRIRVVTPQEYVNIYSTCRDTGGEFGEYRVGGPRKLPDGVISLLPAVDVEVRERDTGRRT